MIEEEGLPRGSIWESCAIMQYLCNTHGLDQFYPRAGPERAMVDSAMFYLIGTLYPLLTRATYPALGFPQYPGEVGTSAADDEMKAEAQQAAAAAIAEPLDVYRAFYLDGKRFIGGDSAVDRRHPPRGLTRVPTCHRLRLSGLGQRVHGRDGDSARRRLLGTGRGRPGVHRVREVAERVGRLALRRASRSSPRRTRACGPVLAAASRSRAGGRPAAPPVPGVRSARQCPLHRQRTP